MSFQDVTDAVVVGWWKIEAPAGEERYDAPSPHDRMTSMREVFAGRTSGSGTARHLDLTLDGTVLDPAALPPAPR